jgi:RNA polymerase sigma factor (TIGR02999 family)
VKKKNPPSLWYCDPIARIFMGMSQITQILRQIDAGSPTATEELLPLVYDELRQLAAARLAAERPGQTLDATALVHEAYLRLLGPQGDSITWDGRGHFFAAAAQAMRRILIDNARRKARIRHGGTLARIALPEDPAEEVADAQLLALDEALSRLAQEDAQAAQIVELHHFAGLSYEQTAAALEISIYLVRQKWAYARAWLQAELAP